MYRRAAIAICSFSLLFGAAIASAQPTSLPTVTAESESWYLAGEPLLHDGNVYYPRGAAVHFNRSEFVRTGFYRGIPLYSRTTLEPFSMMFVPLAGGLMQPYERLRVGEVVGTTGSLGASLPVPVGSDERRERRGLNMTTTTAQAAGPPTGLAGPVDIEGNPRLNTLPVATTAETLPRAVGTAGTTTPSVVGTPGRVVVMPRPQSLVTAARPTGANGISVAFDNARWFSSGHTADFDPAVFRQVGEYGGLPVYVRQGEVRTIYIPVASGVGGTLARYSRR